MVHQYISLWLDLNILTFSSEEMVVTPFIKLARHFLLACSNLLNCPAHSRAQQRPAVGSERRLNPLLLSAIQTEMHPKLKLLRGFRAKQTLKTPNFLQRG